MDRRKFISELSTWVGIIGGGFGVAQVVGPWLLHELTSPNISDRARRAAEDLFYLNKRHISIAPASNNPNVRERLIALKKNTQITSYDQLFSYFSTATIKASNAFKPFLFPPEGKNKFEHLVNYETVQRIIAADSNHTIIALGTPTSNHIVRDMMFYEEMPNPKDGFMYHKPYQDLIHMPIRFELLANVILSEDSNDIWYNSKDINGNPGKKIPNWGIRTPLDKLLLPATNNGVLLEDFLVISVLPNFTSPDNVDRQVPVVCMGGAHAAGTLAIRKLLETEDCLTSLQSELERLGRPTFWQAVFRVSLNSDSGDVRQLHLEKDMVRKVDVDRDKLVEYAENNPPRA